MKARFTFFSLMVILSACVGTNLKDDPIIGERIEVSRQQVDLQPGQNVQLMAEYYDQYGISAIYLNVGLFDYRCVVFLYKPANVTFG